MFKNDEFITALKALVSFSNLNEDELQKICEICKFRRLEPGECLNENGQPSQELSIILSGAVGLNIRGVQISTIQLGRGNLLGEISFFSGMPYTGTSVAETVVEAIVISHRDLRTLLDENSQLGMKVYKNFVLEILSKFNVFSSQVMDLVMGDPKVTAHDIRSPLAALKTIAIDSFNQDMQKKELLNFVIERMERIVSSFFSNYNDKTYSKENTTKDLIIILNNIVQEKRSQHVLPSPKLQLVLTLLSENQTNRVIFEKTELERVISNLIDNSIQAIRDQGKIELIFDLTSSSAQIIVRDNGIGIPKKIVSQLGNFQITYGKTHGNGIGLFNAFRKVKSWGGQVEVHSTENVGTTVTLSLLLGKK